jgi:hypothetical protein
MADVQAGRLGHIKRQRLNHKPQTMGLILRSGRSVSVLNNQDLHRNLADVENSTDLWPADCRATYSQPDTPRHHASTMYTVEGSGTLTCVHNSDPYRWY